MRLLHSRKALLYNSKALRSLSLLVFHHSLPTQHRQTLLFQSHDRYKTKARLVRPSGLVLRNLQRRLKRPHRRRHSRK